MFFKKRKLNKSLLNAFISIGAGTNQTSLIRTAKQKGFKLIGVDTNSMAAGLAFCDLKIHESISDYESIYQTLSEALLDVKITSIMTRSFGDAVKTTAFLCEKFSLPYLPFNSCNNFMNKALMKTALTKHGIKTPATIRMSSSSKIAKNFEPIIKKPIDGHAKQGIKLITTAKGFNDELSSTTKKDFIYEKFIEGDEIIAIGIVNNKRYHLADITDKITSKEPPFLDVMHVSPSKYYHLWERISEIGQAISDMYYLESSPLIIEFIVDKDETIYAIEAIPEFGGEFLADIVVPKATGYNFLSEAINSQTGIGFMPPIFKKNHKAVAVRYLTANEGVLQSWNKQAVMKTSGVFYFDMFKAPGTKLPKLTSNLNRVGVIIAQDRTTEQAINAVNKAVEAVNIQVKK